MPRFQGDNLRHNLALVERCARSPTARASASPRSRSPGCCRAARTSCRSSARAGATSCNEALGALEVELSADDLERIEAAVPPDAAAGDRYGAPQMADLDSER